jgi:hypothetical protein
VFQRARAPVEDVQSYLEVRPAVEEIAEQFALDPG